MVDSLSGTTICNLCGQVILRRIRETSENELPDGARGIAPNDVAVYFVERTGDGVSAKRLRIDETGEFIDRLLHGFFRERGKESF